MRSTGRKSIGIRDIASIHSSAPSVWTKNNPSTREDEDSSFDWFKSYGEISSTIHDIIPDKAARILMLGCGNSKLTEEMYDDGYKNIANIDYSQVVIDKMQRRHAGRRPELTWLEMDIRDLKFADDAFDVAIDKGTMDAMMTSKGDVWDPPAQVIEDCDREVMEVVR
ncbi:hypothetical protein CCMSSC00406_0004845 [Pleurotus cornucopiae]|uniref:Uncharacterized protein n=1 Tax=Pleurotus cornucopiae TaxID=5321 RepID=A0ACB7IZV1_PLECO|nr:hypothetical protein CCMSSC00406_0004845 [Pleurotus cornucopiae]